MNKLALLLLTAAASWAAAECAQRPQGREIRLEVRACRNIAAGKHKDIPAGALITDEQRRRWLYPSEKSSPCKDFPKKKVVSKLAYYTCCDTGHWGKCAFGGNWLGDAGGKPLDYSQ